MLRPIGQNLASVAEAMALALISLSLVAGVASVPPAADPVLRQHAFAVDPTDNTHPRTQALEIENYGIEPVRLAQVTVEGKAPSE